MRTALIIPTFLSGGMERVMNELANYWAIEGVHIDLIFLVRHTPFYSINGKVNSISMPSLGYKKNVFSKLFYKIYLFFFLKKRYKNLKPDVILSFGEGYNAFVILSALGDKIDVFVSNRSNPLKILPTSRRILQKILYTKAKGIFVQTSLAEKVLKEKIGHDNIIIMPNPIKIIPKIDIQRRNIILNVGRLVKEKNQIGLIRIFDEIENEGWELHIIGEGPLRALLENEIEKRKLEKSVKLLGVKEDLSKYMSQSKIFAFTSISEGYPNALCEAMAFPMPCISFDCNSGPRDILQDGKNGFLIESENNISYKERLYKLMNSEDLRDRFMKEASLIRNEQTIDVIGNRIMGHLKKGHNSFQER
ncbi:glycosyltransferase [Flagellimonas sp. 389]|uniref:glycosyltransferase n=1 Tax=Flagellimonas sp. 389 TaxID=2835862 RepID=UPI001BD30703|nr:glycosyltransferase [Flagellimonas sp. 389]MBS9461267.1 glycosyltransferase [Flagellimonas sp. 389]